MKITFLGTGTSSGVPLIGCNCAVCSSLDYRDQRLRTSVHLEINGKSFVIDTSPDFRQQMLRAGIKHLDAVLFTHQHKDHIAGLDDVRAYNFFQGSDMPIYARDEVLTQLQIEFAYVFAEKRYPGIPRLQLNEIKNEPFEIEGVSFLPIDVMHHLMPVFGFRVGRFAYITDVNHISESEQTKLQNLDVLVLGALQRQSHISHYNLNQALEIVAQIQPKRAYFTHISHRMGLQRDLDIELPPHVRLAYDGLQLNL
ncbi:MAG: MBL fold metallo-hydrolase [Cytophagia bacterium]|nr:MAG: MBL fold metallo-hydrolase [Runella sp.]TAG23717.1 MAG: MBL fold metallo-hydrolase [Cytophagales bacterium]TAG42982.1 MAG: MBL fold metallo-hydrolase [Cytophagia bacterium]TAG50909.1 MAG: MBL fold metallo-hydrolase [Runella slithyformis]TAG76462.1 MAG: MBL fold metallo-hydrolase [Cytophagales bacterium]